MGNISEMLASNKHFNLIYTVSIVVAKVVAGIIIIYVYESDTVQFCGVQLLDGARPIIWNLKFMDLLLAEKGKQFQPSS